MTSLRDRLMVNAGALMLSSAASGVLGLVYWILAGRLFPAAEVGRASALISTATMLSSVACLSLGGAYQRFLPLAGRRTTAAIVGGYALTAVTAVLLGGAFAWSGLSRALLDDPRERLAFPAMVVIFAVFALTDAVLTGLRRAPAVAAKNVSASVLKIVPLLLIGAGAAAAGIVVSWTAVSLLVAVIFVALAVREARTRRAPAALPPTRELLSFQGAFLAMMLVSSAMPLLLPLIVVHRLGPAENAYFNLAWTMCSASGLLRGGLVSAFIVEASVPGADRRALLRRAAPVYGGVAALTAVGLGVGGPLVLALTGGEYLRQAWPLMVVMAGASLLECLVTGYYTLAQLVRRLRPMVLAQLLVTVVTVAGSYLLVPEFGITAVGMAQAAALILALGLVARPLRRDLRELSAAPAPPPLLSVR